MLPPGLDALVSSLPHALLRVAADGRAAWVDPGFQQKTGAALAAGGSVWDVLERGQGREALREALETGRAHAALCISSALRQVRVTLAPLAAGEPEAGAWVLFEPGGLEDEAAFAQAVQEIARAVGETLDVERVCAAATLALVRCAQVRRAEVWLAEAGQGLVRVAVSDLAEAAPATAGEAEGADEGTLERARASGSPQIGVQRGYGDALGSIYAALPLLAQKRCTGLLLLYKEPGAAFGVRELDLWSAAAGQLAVAVENARLLREAQAALRVREEFMSIASHELKTPLTPLKLGLFAMERRLAQGLPVELGSVLKGKRQVDRLATLVDDLLDASRLELGKLQLARAPLELGQLVAEVVDQFRHAFERPFRLSVPRERAWVLADRDRVEQVLVNLLENAHKYSPAGAPIGVEVERDQGVARLHVRDRGIGIPSADQAQLFQRFYRARNASARHFGGLGLGLFISHTIARLHGGDLAVKSAEGQGSTFSLTLPRLPSAEAQALPRRVLLFDEDRQQEAEAERLLREGGFEVLTARDGAEALRKAAQLPLDAVLLSASAPEQQAGHFLETLASLPRARPVPLVLAGEAPAAWAGLATGRCARPYRAAELAAAVRAALAH